MINKAKDIAKFTNDSVSAVNCFSCRAKKDKRESISLKRLLIYRILANCDLNSLEAFKDDSNFVDNGIYAKNQLPNIKALKKI